MFGGMKDLAGLAGMMKDLPKMQARLAEVRNHLSDIKVTASDPEGHVHVRVNGTLEVESIQLSPTLLSSVDGAEALQERIKTTVNEALAQARAEAQAKIAGVAQEMGMPLPPGGLDL